MPKTYRGRTPQEQRDYNRARKERYKQAKARAQKADDDISIDIEPSDMPAMPVPSLKDKILSHFEQEDSDDDDKPTKQQQSHIDKSENLVSSVLPLTISGMVALYSKRLFAEPYKPCAPTKQEVSAILTPIFSVIARHVELTGKASQDAIDIASSLLSALTLGTRMLMTAEVIRANTSSENIVDIRARASENSASENIGIVRPDTNQAYSNGYGGVGGPNDTGPGNDTDASLDNRSREAKQFAELMHRDTLGRRQMGLAPRTLPGTD